MSHYEIVDGPTDDTIEAIVEVGLAQPIHPKDTTDLIQSLLKPLTGTLSASIYGYLSYLEVSDSTVRTRFRFARAPQENEVWDNDSEDMSRLRIQFIFYVFAWLDRSYPLSDVPFPPFFRNFLRLPNELGMDT